MNSRERFLATMHFESVSPCLLWEWHYLEDTITRWHREGLPAEVYLPALKADDPLAWLPDGDKADGRIPIGQYFGLDRGQPYCQGEVAYVPVNTGMLPAYEERILAEDDQTCTLVDTDGVTKQILKGRSPAMPRFIDFPVKSREDFEAILPRYDPADPARYPAWWESFKERVRSRDYPLGLVFDGFFGRIRKWMGFEGLCFALMDEPALFQAMCEFHTEFILRTIRRAVEEVDIDYVNIWEDMAYKGGPLMSPALVRKYMFPGYRKIADLLRGHGIDVIFVDSDGNIEELIPIWLEAGINGVWPLEVAAGMDAVSLRQRYGRELLLVGGIDKRELSKGRTQVYDEVMRQVPYLNSTGGFVPTVDHSVPPDIPLENYVYFRQLLRELA